MKWYFKISIFVVSIVSVLLFIQIKIESSMKKVTDGNIGKINAVMKHELDEDITVWGASTAYVHFDAPMISDSLNLSTFNMGIDGTNIDQYYGLLKEYLNYTKNSRYIVIALDVHGAFMKRDALYDIHNWTHHFSNKNIDSCFSEIDADLMWKSKYIPFYKLTVYNKHNFRYVRQNLFSDQKSYQFAKKGYQPKSTFLKDVNRVDQKSQKVDINKRVFKKLKQACLLAQSKSIQPIVVITPCYEKGFNLLENADEVVAKINSLSNYGVEVFDYSQSKLSNNPSLFCDFTHLNTQGATEFSKLFLSGFKSQFLEN